MAESERHRFWMPGKGNDVWCPVGKALASVRFVEGKEVCFRCATVLSAETAETMDEAIARTKTPLYREIDLAAPDFLRDSSEYGYGGELVEFKEVDVEALYGFVERKLREQREAIASWIEGPSKELLYRSTCEYLAAGVRSGEPKPK